MVTAKAGTDDGPWDGFGPGWVKAISYGEEFGAILQLSDVISNLTKSTKVPATSSRHRSLGGPDIQ